MAWRQVAALTRMRLLLLLREPEALFWTLAFPVLLAAALGYAFRDVEPAPSRVAIVPGAGDAHAPLLAALHAAPDLELVTARTAAELEHALRRGALDAIVELGAPVRVHADRQRQAGETARLRVVAALAQVGRAPDAPAVSDVTATRIGARYVDYLFPGLLGLNVAATGLWAIGFAVVEERSKHLLRRMLATPMRRSSYLLSFVLSRLLFLVLEVGVLLAFGAWVLDVPMRGSVTALVVLALAGALAFAGLGLLVASRARTIEGISGLTNLVMMPLWLGCGVFFSHERFPAALQPWLAALPLTPLNDGLRAILLDGAGPLALALPLAWLAAWGSAGFLGALILFRWR